MRTDRDKGSQHRGRRFSFIPNHLLLEFTMLSQGIVPAFLADKLGICRDKMYLLLRAGKGANNYDIKRIGHALGLKDEEIFVPRHPLTGLPYHTGYDKSKSAKTYQSSMRRHQPSLCISLTNSQDEHRFFPPPEEDDMARIIANATGGIELYPHLISFQGNVFAWYDFLERFAERKTQPPEKKYLTPREVAEMFGVSIHTILLWRKRGVPPEAWTQFPNKKWHAHKSIIEDYIIRRRKVSPRWPRILLPSIPAQQP